MMMKRYIFTAVAIALSCALSWSAAAQEDLSKQLEVTRAYTPRVGQAEKLPVTPDMTDTVRLRPEVSYRITSTASTTSFEVRPFEAATIAAAPFEATKPFYIRAGAGAPYTTVLDIYYTPRMKAGRSFGIFANHNGAHSRLTNDIGVKADAREMASGAGIWAARQWKRYSLKADITYENRSLDMYGYAPDFTAPNNEVLEWERVGWNRIGARVGFGDDFTDMSRFNFRIDLDGGYTHRAGKRRHFDTSLLPKIIFDENGQFAGFSPSVLPGNLSYSYSRGRLYFLESIVAEGLASVPDPFVEQRKPAQADMGLKVRMGTMFGDRGHGFDAALGLRYGVTFMDYENGGSMEPYKNNLFGSASLALRYIMELERFKLRIGGDLFYINNRIFEQDRVRVRPAAEVSYDIADDRFIPFATLSSRILDGSMEAMSRRNPYVYYDGATGLETDLRAGIMGDFGDVFSYRLAAGGSLLNDYNLMMPSFTNFGAVMFFPSPTKGTRWMAGIELGLHDVGGFSAKLYGNWYLNKLDGLVGDNILSSQRVSEVGTWLPDFEAGLALGYAHRDKFTVSAGADITGTREYGFITEGYGSINRVAQELYSIAPVVDVFVNAEVKVARDFWVWVEGRNLANQKLYPQPYYRGRGVNVTGGIKVVF